MFLIRRAGLTPQRLALCFGTGRSGRSNRSMTPFWRVAKLASAAADLEKQNTVTPDDVQWAVDFGATLAAQPDGPQKHVAFLRIQRWYVLLVLILLYVRLACD
jgi:hypothetical protein